MRVLLIADILLEQSFHQLRKNAGFLTPKIGRASARQPDFKPANDRQVIFSCHQPIVRSVHVQPIAFSDSVPVPNQRPP